MCVYARAHTHILIFPNRSCYLYVFFRDDHLVLNKQLVCSSLAKTVSPLTTPSLPGVLCIWSRLCGFSPRPWRVCCCCSAQVIAVLLVDFLGVAPDIPRRYDLTANTLMLWPLQPLVCSVPYTLGVGVGSGLHNSVLIGCVSL